VAPVSPLAPVSPFWPVLPVGPVAPVTPVAPVGPVTPLAPVGPVGPLGLSADASCALLKNTSRQSMLVRARALNAPISQTSVSQNSSVALGRNVPVRSGGRAPQRPARESRAAETDN